MEIYDHERDARAEPGVMDSPEMIDGCYPVETDEGYKRKKEYRTPVVKEGLVSRLGVGIAGLWRAFRGLRDYYGKIEETKDVGKGER